MSKQSVKDEFSYIASGKTNGAPKQLVVLIHGYGRDAHVMKKQAEEIEKLMPEALVIMPHAPDVCDVPDTDEGNMLKVPQVVRADGDVDENNKRRQWFSIYGDKKDIQNKVIAVSKRINKFISRQRDRHGLDDKDIAVMGFSQGGSLALYTAFSRASEIGCVVGHSALFFEIKHLPSKPDTFFIYGLQDEEFEPKVYESCAQLLSRYAGDLSIKSVKGLGHRTSSESRKYVARYIANKMK